MTIGQGSEKTGTAVVMDETKEGGIETGVIEDKIHVVTRAAMTIDHLDGTETFSRAAVTGEGGVALLEPG